MVPSRRSRRLIPSTLLALLLAVGTVAGAVGRDTTAPSTSLISAPQAPVPGSVKAAIASPAWVDPEPEPRYDGRIATGRSASAIISAPSIHQAAAAAGDRVAPSSSGYRGRNHLWVPALRIDRSVAWYGCSNKSYPGDRVYRWGCAGRNNVYLFGHAYSVFKKLHDAYVERKLRKGMKLFYADSDGEVHTYKLAWWKRTTATKGTWAYKALSRSSVTLQTCVGARSQYRLIVRFVEVD